MGYGKPLLICIGIFLLMVLIVLTFTASLNQRTGSSRTEHDSKWVAVGFSAVLLAVVMGVSADAVQNKYFPEIQQKQP